MVYESLDECGWPEGRSATWPTVNLEIQFEQAQIRLDAGRAAAKKLDELVDPGDPDAQAEIRQELKELAGEQGVDVAGLLLAELQLMVGVAQQKVMVELEGVVERPQAKVEAARYYNRRRRSRRALTGCLPAESSLLRLVS